MRAGGSRPKDGQLWCTTRCPSCWYKRHFNARFAGLLPRRVPEWNWRGPNLFPMGAAVHWTLQDCDSAEIPVYLPGLAIQRPLALDIQGLAILKPHTKTPHTPTKTPTPPSSRGIITTTTTLTGTFICILEDGISCGYFQYPKLFFSSTNTKYKTLYMYM